MSTQNTNASNSYDKILYLLKSRGDQSATMLSSLLSMTMMGARKLLLELQKKELVYSYQQKAGRGRPKLMWSLSEKGHTKFPDRHADLTLQLITNIRNTLGQQDLERLLMAREQQTLEAYSKQLNKELGLGNRLQKLADIRSEEGYMAEVQEQSDGSYLLIENHCPICVAAQTCQGFCRSELTIFRKSLSAQVERVEYILDGARRCAYRITGL
ncbi:MAG: transcriptional regulator [Kangiellaceae bacterium]|nr:transcriptional regulator [Kangiellaceae bacterium]